MDKELANDTIDGVVPIYSLLMARGNRKIVSIKEVRLSEAGDLIEVGKGDTIRNGDCTGMEVCFSVRALPGYRLFIISVPISVTRGCKPISLYRHLWTVLIRRLPQHSSSRLRT